ncbi:MAG: hypothetical protein JKY54_19745 [Flavobacteriales bacterium]|nr:hypothetical protein [Flavobacteriales bacterium]
MTATTLLWAGAGLVVLVMSAILMVNAHKFLVGLILWIPVLLLWYKAIRCHLNMDIERVMASMTLGKNDMHAKSQEVYFD